MDEPSFTQPTMYSGIVSRDQVPDLYFTALSEQGVDTEDISSELEVYKKFLSEESKKAETYEAEATHLSKQWTGIKSAQKGVVAHFDTGEWRLEN
jgi:2-oxoglutarate dehydrogenase E1 component